MIGAWASIHRFLKEEDGPTAAEYAVLLAMILGAIIAVVAGLGGSTAIWWERNVNQITAGMDSVGR